MRKHTFRQPQKVASSSEEKSSAPTAMAHRQASGASALSALSDDAVPTSHPRDTSELLAERLQAWKHAVVYLENYIAATEKVEKAQAKAYEGVLKAISDPLKEGHHFDQSLGGLAGLFENMRANTQGLINTHLETEKNLKGSVLPILERLHHEIKNKSKELASGAVKGAKEVEKARNLTQKHIELLGQRTADFESSGSKITPHDDPYALQRQVYYYLNKQVLEENNNRQDLISVQRNFATFEYHVIEVIQQTMASFNQFVGGQAQRVQNMYADMVGTAQRIPPDFEWKGFVTRKHELLIDENAPPRSVDSITFPNQNHKSTQPMIEGSLERKSRNILSHGYSTGYYVITPTKFLHEFKDTDNYRKEPVAELSIYLPDATIGTPNGPKFNIKGKDLAKGIAAKLAGHSEYAFKAHTADDAQKWFEIIRNAGGISPAEPFKSVPSSPVEERKATTGTVGDDTLTEQRIPTDPEPTPHQGDTTTAKPHHVQTQGITGKDEVASPTTVTPTAGNIAPPADTTPAPVPTTHPTAESKESA